MVRLLWLVGLGLSLSTAALGKTYTFATCGESAGYGFYPRAGLAASQPEAGKWIPDALTGGGFSLTENEGKFDILARDSSGRVFSSTQDGAKVLAVGSTDKSLSVIVSYPNLIETYTFLRNAEGEAEVLWSTNKWGTPIPKIAAYRASCSFFAR
jgi:hypothetical protein